MKKPNTKFNEKQLTIISAGAGALVFAVVCGLIFMAVSSAGRLDADVKKLEVTRTDLAAKERNLPRLEKEIESLQVDVAKSVQVLPNEQEIADLIKNLSGIVNRTEQDGVTIKIRTFEPEQNKSLPGMVAEDNSDQRFTEHPYIVEAQGNYFHLGKFINLLENHIRFIKVETYEMANQKSDKDAGRPEKEIKMKIVTYTYNPGKGEKIIPREKMPLEFDDNGGKFVFDGHNRRDPFQIPLVAESLGAVAETPLTKERQRDLATQAERLHDQLTGYIQHKQVDEAVKCFVELDNIYKQIKRFTVPEYYQSLQQLYSDAKEQVKSIEGAMGKQAIARGEILLEDMKTAFDAYDFRQVRQLKQQLEAIIPGAQLSDEALAAKVNGIKKEAAELVRRSDIRADFFRAGIEISGISIMPRRNTVMFNGSIYGEEGMEVTVGAVKFLVKQIDPRKDQVTVAYQGEEIVLTQGQKIVLDQETPKGRNTSPPKTTEAPAEPAPAPAAEEGSSDGAGTPEAPAAEEKSSAPEGTGAEPPAEEQPSGDEGAGDGGGGTIPPRG